MNTTPALGERSSAALLDFIEEQGFDPADLDQPSQDFVLTPLMRAALLGRDDIVEQLLAHGVDIHPRNSDGNNALWLACVSGNGTLVQRLIEIGQISLDEARHHEHKNVITRSLGARQSGPAGAEAVSLRLKRGDRLMLCSDGLTAHVEDREIAEILRRHSDPYEAARELVAAANAGGGTDNVSVIVVFAS